MSETTPNQSQPSEYKIALPNGEYISALDLLKRHQENGEAEVSTGLLMPGDMLAIQFDGEEESKGIVFEVEERKYKNMHVGPDGSRPLILGRLMGIDLPEEVKDKQVAISGSGWGSSSLQAGLVGTERRAIFIIPNQGEWQTPQPVKSFDIYRPNSEGVLEPTDPNQMDRELQKEAPHHRERLTQAEQLMKRFGFDKYDFRDSESRTRIDSGSDPTYEDENFVAKYSASGAGGNRLSVYDKHTHIWVTYDYRNFRNADFLKVGIADLSGYENTINKNIVDSSDLAQKRIPYSTFDSSGRDGFHAINYIPSGKVAEEALGIPQWSGEKSVLTPIIDIFPDGTINISREYPFSRLDTVTPGTLDKIESLVGIESQHGNQITLKLGDQTVKLKTPEEIFEDLMWSLGPHPQR